MDRGKNDRKADAIEVNLGRGVGKAVLSVTMRGVSITGDMQAPFLDLEWGKLVTATPQGGSRVLLTWIDDDAVAFCYSVETPDQKRLMHSLSEANRAYSRETTFEESMRTIYSGAIKRSAGTVGTGEMRGSWHAAEPPADFEILVRPSIDPAMTPRHPKVPSHVPDKYAWNDTWYDQSKKCFLTHNPLFRAIKSITDTPEQIRHRSATDDASITFKGEDIRFLYGYPAMALEWGGDGGHRSAWTLLPTIAPEMLTQELVMAKVAADASSRRVTYSTRPPGVYSAKFHASVSVHEAVIYNEDLRQHVKTAYPEVISCVRCLNDSAGASDLGTLQSHTSRAFADAMRAHKDDKFLKLRLQVTTGR